MKTILTYFIVLFASFSISSAQTQALYVGGIPLEEIETDYIELRVAHLRPLNATQCYVISYGQACMNQPLQLQTRSFLNNCTGLTGEDGNLIEGFHYSKGLTLLRRAGWELVEVLLESSDGDSNSISDSVFLLRRQELGPERL